MDKLKMQTKNKVDINIETIGNLFPNTLTEVIKGYDIDGNAIIEKAIDFEILKQELSKIIVDGKEERYQMNWPGKKEAILRANAPTNMTLRPCKEESVNFDTTENLYIEGDNLEVLKLLRETYLNKVKMIYIDPPYNTGNDSFVYNDNFSMTSKEFSELSEQYDEDGNMNYDIRKNNESNGKFHTDWLNMMYPRLKLAKDLLSEDGVIFISLDDNESTNMVKICDEIFGASNRISLICHKARASVSNDKIISPNHNTILFYAKSLVTIHNNRRMIGLDPILDGFDYDDNDGKGPYKLVPVDGPGGAKKGNPYYEFLGVEGYFRFSKNTMEEKYKHKLVVKKKNSLYQKYYMSLAKETRKTDTTWWDDAGFTSSATSKLRELMDGAYFDNPKPIELINRMLKLITYSDRNAIILDFFSGSATTSHAVMKFNTEDSGKRKFIMVQLPEETDEKSEANKAGYKNICEIGKERIRRAGKKIVEENSDKAKELDIGFRVLKLDSSNMKDVYYNPSDYDQNLLDKFESNIKEERSSEDLLFQVMLELGEMLSSDIEEINVNGKKVFNVGDGNIIACFDDDVNEEVITNIAKMAPYYAVFRDSSLTSDSVAANFEQIFKTYSPNTIRKIL